MVRHRIRREPVDTRLRNEDILGGTCQNSNTIARSRRHAANRVPLDGNSGAIRAILHGIYTAEPTRRQPDSRAMSDGGAGIIDATNRVVGDCRVLLVGKRDARTTHVGDRVVGEPVVAVVVLFVKAIHGIADTIERTGTDRKDSESKVPDDVSIKEVVLVPERIASTTRSRNRGILAINIQRRDVAQLNTSRDLLILVARKRERVEACVVRRDADRRQRLLPNGWRQRSDVAVLDGVVGTT